MGTFYLCDYPKAKTPYVFRPDGIGVYSMEELCYYLRKNIYFLNRDMVGQGLFLWLENSLYLKKLADELRSEAMQNRSVFYLTAFLFEKSGFFSEEELAGIRMLVASLENRTEMERRLICADEFLQKGALREALYAYLDLLKEENLPLMTEETQSRICEHAGYIYAQMYCFDEAVKLYRQAYALTGSEDARRTVFFLEQTAGLCGISVSSTDRQMLSDAERAELSRAFEMTVLRFEK